MEDQESERPGCTQVLIAGVKLSTVKGLRVGPLQAMSSREE